MTPMQASLFLSSSTLDQHQKPVLNAANSITVWPQPKDLVQFLLSEQLVTDATGQIGEHYVEGNPEGFARDLKEAGVSLRFDAMLFVVTGGADVIEIYGLSTSSTKASLALASYQFCLHWK